MLYERVKITRDPHTVYNRDALPWEIPILEFIFGDGNVIRQPGAAIRSDRPYPEEAGVEFQRLADAFGADPQSGVPYAASVYGQASAGVNHVRRAIAEAKAEDEATKPKPVTKAKRKRAVKASTAADPLMA